MNKLCMLIHSIIEIYKYLHCEIILLIKNIKTKVVSKGIATIFIKTITCFLMQPTIALSDVRNLAIKFPK